MHTLASPTSALPSRYWIWSFPLAFIVHDGEEVVALLRAGQLRSVGSVLSVSQGLAAISFELALFWLIAILAVWSGGRGWPMRVFGAAVCGYTLHGFVHLAAAIYGDGYVFGALTALPAVIVYGGLTLWRLHADGLLTRSEISAGFAFAALAGAPFIYLVHQIGRLIG